VKGESGLRERQAEAELTISLSRKGRLRRLLQEGRFVVTCELSPPSGANVEPLITKTRVVREKVDACNLTDCTTAMVRLSSLASSVAVQSTGVEAIMQLTLRDRNRIGLQSDLLGASALGVRNVLCLYGDPPSAGNEKEARPVYDISTDTFISMVRKMRDSGELLGGGKLSSAPDLFIGAAATPAREDSAARIEKIRRKVDAGAQFIQTQPIFDIPLFEEFMEDMNSSLITSRCRIIAGIMPIKSVKMALHLKEEVKGIGVTDEVVRRMENAAQKEEEGLNIALEAIQHIRKISGVSGIHIMTVGWESIIPRLVEEAGLLPRPSD